VSDVQILLSGTLFTITLIALAIAFHAFTSMKTPGARVFGILCVASAIYTVGYAMELMNTSLHAIDFWGKFQYVGLSFIPALWVLLSIDYGNNRARYNNVFYFFLLMIPMITVFMRFTNEVHHLYYTEMSLVSNGHFTLLQFTKGPWYYVHVVYFIACGSYSTRNYIVLSQKTKALMRIQSLIMASASIIPMIAILMNVVGTFPYGVDAGPFAVFFVFMLLMFGMYRYNILSLIPKARDKAFDWIQDGVLVLDMNFRLIDMNTAAKKYFRQLTFLKNGAELEDVFAHQETIARRIRSWSTDPQRVSEDLSFEIEDELSGSLRHFNVRLSKLYENAIQIGTIIILSDVTASKNMMEQLANLARVDEMTGLMNRRYFFERIHYEVDRANRNGSSLSLILFDLDLFKNVNDRYGHAAGDLILRNVADCCRQALRNVDLFARFGGEEFIVYLPDCSLTDAIDVAERLRSSIEKEITFYMGNEIRITASFGVSNHDCAIQGECLDVNELIRAADEASYIAKREGRNRVQMHIRPIESTSGV